MLQAAQQGQGKAQYELANRLAAKPDYPDAMRWMKQAADQVGPLAADADIRGKAALQVRSWYQAGLGSPKILYWPSRGGSAPPSWAMGKPAINWVRSAGNGTRGSWSVSVSTGSSMPPSGIMEMPSWFWGSGMEVRRGPMKRPSSGWRKPLNRVIVMLTSWKKDTQEMTRCW